MLIQVDKGQTVTVTGQVKTPAGQLADPDDVLARVRRPNGKIDSYRYSLDELTRESVGVYTLRLELELAGRWFVNFTAEDPEEGAVAEDSIVVRSSQVS